MKLFHEFDLIARIRKQAEKIGIEANVSKVFPIPNGDDACGIKVKSDEILLVSTDIAVENIHFDLNIMPAKSVGYRTLAANVSDISAMGGAPLGFLLSMAIPKKTPQETVDAITGGILECAAKAGVKLLGGNISSEKNSLVISITIFGEAGKNGYLLRSGAKAGDHIFITAPLGLARAGLMAASQETLKTDWAKRLMTAFQKPPIRTREGVMLTKLRASAMIDVSDGLRQDMQHLMEHNKKLGAEIYAELLPIPKELKRFAEYFEVNPYEIALAGGEDYELLFTIPQEGAKKIKAKQLPFIEIGKITNSGKLKILFNGKPFSTKLASWEHF